MEMPKGMVHSMKWSSYSWNNRGMNWLGAPEGGYGCPKLRLQGVPGAPRAGSNGVLPTGKMLWFRSWLASWRSCQRRRAGLVTSRRINRICPETLQRQKTEPASHGRRDSQRLYWAVRWMTEMKEAGDMRPGNRGRVLLHLALHSIWHSTPTGRDRFNALGGDKGNKLHHERVQTWSNSNQSSALRSSNRWEWLEILLCGNVHLFLVGCPHLGCCEEIGNLSSPVTLWWSSTWASMILSEETLSISRVTTCCCTKGAGERHGCPDCIFLILLVKGNAG